MQRRALTGTASGESRHRPRLSDLQFRRRDLRGQIERRVLLGGLLDLEGHLRHEVVELEFLQLGQLRLLYDGELDRHRLNGGPRGPGPVNEVEVDHQPQVNQHRKRRPQQQQVAPPSAALAVALVLELLDCRLEVGDPVVDGARSVRDVRQAVLRQRSCGGVVRLRDADLNPT